MGTDKILSAVSELFKDKLEAYGPTPHGVDYSSAEAQRIRFDQLMRLCNLETPFSLNDYGCGYGGLLGYLMDRKCIVEYRGYDVCEPMVVAARKEYAKLTNCRFFSDPGELSPADYTVACAIFNLRLTFSGEEWLDYIVQTLHTFHRVSRKGFAFNGLTKYSDPERMRPDLYYADPCFLFDYCKRNFSRNVALLHDYELYDFTILVRL